MTAPPGNRRVAVQVAFSFCALAAVLVCQAAIAAPTEYAIRWAAAEGGPKSATEVLQLLKLEPKKKVETFEVRYFRTGVPADAPALSTSIVRERSDGSEPQITFKYRADLPLPATASWKCPLTSFDKSKFETDITFLGAPVRKAYSWSCTGAGSLASLLPGALLPQPVGCGARMVRRESKGMEYKVEEWQLKTGATVLEVSWTATDDAKDQQQFADQVVAPLLARIKPLDRSKTEIGSSC